MRNAMQRSLLVIIVLLAPFSVFSQVTKESKKSAYKELKTRSSRSVVNDLLDQAETLKEVSPQTALDKVKEALAMSIADRNSAAESRCYNLLGEINLGIQEWKLALENYLTAREKSGHGKEVDTRQFIKSLHGIGVSHLELGNYDEALKSLNQIFSLRPTNAEAIEARLAVSEVYYRKGNYDESLEALNQIELGKMFDPADEVRIDNQRAKIYARLKQVDKASDILTSNQARTRSASTPAPKQEAEMQSVKEEISGVYTEQKRYDDEISLRENSIDYNLDVKNFGEVSKDKVELSKALAAKGETSEAIRELEEAANIADTIGDPKRQAVAYLSLADLYEKHGNRDEALRTYKKYSNAVTKTEQEQEKKLLEKSALIKTQRDIEEFSKFVSVEQQQESLSEAMVARQRLIIYGLIVIILIIGVTSYFIYKNAMASKVANQLLALKSLRSQMNPHFIFNALNSVNHFVSQNDERATNRFLSEFSRLMRLVLENSQEDFIPLIKEEEIISLYLKLEHYRFRDKFDYEIVMDETINKEALEIPPMLIQPYIENAVWHGLRYKDTKGFLSIRFETENGALLITVTDNGIGRKRSAELKTQNQKKHESTGLKNIKERLGIINKVYKSNYKVEIGDVEGSGTQVKLFVPINHKIESHA